MPFVGQAGKLLEQLLGEIGLERSDVFIANVLKCLRYNAPDSARRRELGADRTFGEAALQRHGYVGR